MAEAIIVAAGSGSRFGGETPKQFRIINGRTVLEHTLERFDHCPSISRIILVVSEEFADKLPFENRFSKLAKIVQGGATRADSVLNGLKHVEDGIVAVHDGARPLVSSKEIEETIEAAKVHGAACLVTPVSDTIKHVSDGKIEKTIDRTDLRKALTPQCFETDLLKKAYKMADSIANATDECSLVESLGEEIVYVEGSSRNIKITYEDDLKIAEALL